MADAVAEKAVAHEGWQVMFLCMAGLLGLTVLPVLPLKEPVAHTHASNKPQGLALVIGWLHRALAPGMLVFFGLHPKLGPIAEQARAAGLPVTSELALLPDECDATIANDGSSAVELAARYDDVVYRFDVSSGEVVQIKVGSELQDCYHFRVSSAPGPIDLWFDRFHRLVRQEFTESGHKTIVQLIQVRR